MIVIPNNINFIDWTSTLEVDLPDLDIPLATSESKWKEWVLNFIDDNKLSQVPLPDKFNSWRDWADYFVTSYDTII
jgi:hypothetical protein